MFGKYVSQSVEETKKLAAEFAKHITSGNVIGLVGDLGSGKTVFCQGLAKALNIAETVGSPTFKFISEYEGAEQYLYHIDCYRLENIQQFINIGGEEYLTPIDGITLIEWADLISQVLPNDAIIIDFMRILGKPNCRELHIHKSS